MKNARICPFCESNDVEEKSTSSLLKIENKLYDVETFFCECNNCGSEFAEKIETKKNSRAIVAMKKRALNLLSGSEVKEIRTKYSISIEQANLLFGGGPVAFSKYENDELCQSSQTDLLLKLARKNPAIIEQIIKEKQLESHFYNNSEIITRKSSTVFSENNLSEFYYDPKVYRNQSDSEGKKNAI